MFIHGGCAPQATPSYVAFTDTERLIGDAAKNQLARNPENTLFDAKRLIGRNFEDPSVQSDMKHWPFQVVSYYCGMLKLQAKYKGEQNNFFPEEISAMVLTKLKETAEAYIGKKVTNAVITVPAFFNYSQRQATRDAATIAGLNAARIITAPRAVALAYCLGKCVKKGQEWNVLILDLGGGNWNVSILNMKKDCYSVRSTAGDTHLGGEDFDNRMVNHFMQEFERKFGKDLSKNKRALGRLRTACERAKRTLSSSTQASIEIEALFDGIDFSTSISRARFEEMNADLFLATLDPVKKSLSDANMDKAQIHDIVLVGGSSRIPKIQKLLRDFFNGKELNMSMNPDEAVAYDAAVQAAIIYGDEYEALDGLIVNDVTPFSLGIETAGGAMTVLIKRNTPIPTKPSRILNQRGGGLIQVYEGEHALTKDNSLLGKINFSDMLPALREASQAEVTFHIDGLGVLNMTVIEKSTGKESKMTINGKGRLPDEVIEQIVKESHKYRIDDAKQKERVSAKNSLESFCLNMKIKCNDTIRWLDANPLAKKEEFDDKQKELQQACNPTMAEMYAAGGGAPPNSAAGCSGTRAKRSRLSHN